MITISSPFDGHEVGRVDDFTQEETAAAIGRAEEHLDTHLPTWRRAEILYEASQRIGERRDDFARLIAEESAKPMATARVEAERALSTLGWSSIAARDLKGEMIAIESAMVGEGKLAYTQRVPIGVVGAITPFNFPLNLVCHKVGPAIAAGCPVVLKPASQTPLTSIALARMLVECGLPEGWLQVVTGAGGVVGDTIVRDERVSLVSFTGSADVGWTLAARAPKKKISLELGNSTPMIVTADSKWREAADGAVTGGFTHAGQSCISVQRVYVERSIEADFVEHLVAGTKKLEVGDPLDERTAVSALISRPDRDRVKTWIDEALDQGADVRCGGDIRDDLLMPTVLTGTDLGMKVCSEEVFGPVVGVAAFDSLDEAIELANGTRYGLQAGIYTSNIDDAMHASRCLDFGAVLINETPTWRADIMPYGGVKDSGNTKEGPRYSVEEMTRQKLVVMNT